MFKWFRTVPPIVGSKWVLRDGSMNPYREDRIIVTILDIKDGWVKYKFRYTTTSSLSIRMFRSLYREEPTP